MNPLRLEAKYVLVASKLLMQVNYKSFVGSKEKGECGHVWPMERQAHCSCSLRASLDAV